LSDLNNRKLALILLGPAILIVAFTTIYPMHGTYGGVPAYGPTNGAPITLLGASHFELRDGRVLREWRIYDEVAAMAQIAAAGRP
jgi:hypothetical protein